MSNDAIEYGNIFREKPTISTLINFQKPVVQAFQFEGEREIDMLQRFFIQIMEECTEYDDEIRSLPETTDILAAIDEFADIVLYLSSILATYSLDCPNDMPTIVNTKLNSIELNKVAEFYSDLDFTRHDRDNICMSVINELSHIRMNYPERKYHKKHKEISDLAKESRRADTIERIQTLILFLIDSEIANISSMYVPNVPEISEDLAYSLISYSIVMKRYKFEDNLK